MTTIYDFEVLDAQEKVQSLSQFKGKVVLIVNTASKCGFTPQYEGLQAIYQKYQSKGFEVLAFPCNQFAFQEPGSNAEIQQFCQLNYNVSFPVFAKINVNGRNTHPLYKFLRSQTKGPVGNPIKWNFTKFLVDRQGQVVERFEPVVKPEELSSQIESLLAKPTA